MDRYLEFFAPMLIVCLLLNSQFAAAPQGGQPIVVNPIVNIDISGVINAITGATGQMKDFTGKLPQQGFGLFKDYFEDSLKEFNSPLNELFYILLASPPDLEPMKGIWQGVASLISSFYLLNFALAGIMFTLAFDSHSKRAEAKEWLKGIAIAIVLVSSSFDLYKIAVETGTASAEFILGGQPEKFMIPAMLGNGNPVLLIISILAAGFAGFTLFLRQMVLLVGVGMFPAGIFMFFTPPLKQFGKAIFGILGTAIFLQFFDAIIIIAASGAISEMNQFPAAAYLPAFAFFTIGIFNIAAMGFAIFRPIAQIAGGFAVASIIGGSIARHFAHFDASKKQSNMKV